MIIEVANQSPRENYKLITGSVVPRPVAWVSTLGPDGELNLAPYSFFNGVSGNPPTVIVSCGRRDNKDRKDTASNAMHLGEFVVNIVNMDVAEQMNLTANDLPYGMSEFEWAGLTPAASHLVRPPRVAEAPISMECRLAQTVTVGVPPNDHVVLFGTVVCWHIRDDLYDQGRINFGRLQPLGRLAGNLYSKPGEIFEMIRPKYQPE